MKKLLLTLCLGLSIILFRAPMARAEDVITYPFDAITITSAISFQIEITALPETTSILYDAVVVGNVLTLYIGTIVYTMESVETEGGSILIVTDEEGEDILAWIVNSYGTDLTTYKLYDYASWITVDPAIGVIKDFTGDLMEVSIEEDLISGDYTFIDNADTSWTMLDGTLLVEEDLEIVISAYEGA